MLNAQEAEAAFKDIPYPESDDKDILRVMWAAYNEETAQVLGEFRDWLANEYASNLPSAVQEKIWSEAREKGSPYGYAAVEDYYAHYAEFAGFVRNVK
jgi:hypothetical protein